MKKEICVYDEKTPRIIEVSEEVLPFEQPWLHDNGYALPAWLTRPQEWIGRDKEMFIWDWNDEIPLYSTSGADGQHRVYAAKVDDLRKVHHGKDASQG